MARVRSSAARDAWHVGLSAVGTAFIIYQSPTAEPEKTFLLQNALQWLRRIGSTVGLQNNCVFHKHFVDLFQQTSDLNRLNIVHVAGTKGKGTTCAYVNSILQSYNQSTGTPRKIGLYTSPHLVAVRERI